MTPNELDRRLDNVISDLESGAYAQVMMSVALAALAKIRSRVQESGTDASGSKYREYSESYKTQKIAAGKYKGYVDFSFTNRMWNNINLKSDTSQLATGVAVVAPTTPEDKKKLHKNVIRRGAILEVSDSEEEELVDIYNDELLQIFRRNGL